MSNKQAPYKNEETMNSITSWWNKLYPENKAGWPDPLHIIQLYEQYQHCVGMSPLKPGYLDANQFAKCLVAARITDLGNGSWTMLEHWVPKPYEIARAKVY